MRGVPTAADARAALALVGCLAAACSANPLRTTQPCDPMGATLESPAPGDGPDHDADAPGDPSPGADLTPAGVCDPTTQPSPDWVERDGQCLASCDRLGGDRCELSASCPAGWVPVPLGPAYDCGACCVWGHTGGGCLDQCGGTAPDGGCECDLGCLVRGDCCDDYLLVCD